MADFEGTKELNFDENVSLGELGRLRLENRDLQLAREKLVKKLDKKKNELEIEKTNAITFRQFIQELNRKVELLEREPIPVISPLRIDPGPGLTGEVVERLVMEKTGLESNLAEQKTEIETLNTKIVLTNQSLEIVRGENARFEKLVPELKLELSRMENECKRMSTSTISEDETIETETLKTRLQDLSITNKHYLSQLQKKDLTIAKSTNKFDTEKEQILERSRLEIEKLKQNETSLNEQLIKVKRELDQKCSGLEDDKSVLEIQVDVLNGQIGELSEERERWKGRVVELETSLTDLQLQLQKLGEVQQNETATVQKYEQQLTELTNQITILNNELTSVKDSALVRKQLITKLNQDIEVLETNKDNIQQRLNDKTSETETLKTRIQELSLTNKHYLSQLKNKLDESQYEVTELLRKCNSLQKSKNEIEDTLQTELKESRDEVFLLKTETNRQKETIDKQNEVIETYKQQQITEEYKASETKDKQISHLKMVNLELEANRQTCDTHILELNDELQQTKSDYKDLDDLRKQFESELADKCSALEDEKSVLEIQVDVLNGQIGELSEERERWKGRVVELETTLTDLQLQLQKLGEVQQNETATVQKYEQQITELTNQITILNNELTSVKDSASISKQLINKLNQDIEVLETNNKQTIVEFQTKLTQSERDREDLERKLVEMIRELANRDSRIQELSQPVVIPQSRGQVPKSPSIPVMPTNPNLKEEDKSQSRFPAINLDLTPEVIPQANKTGKSPSKMAFRGVNIHVVKLKAFPNPTESYNKQVICPINKRYELGKLMYIAELLAKAFPRVVSKYAGIQLYNPVGNCDGTYRDKRYFECPPNYGIFVPLEDVYVPVP